MAILTRPRRSIDRKALAVITEIIVILWEYQANQKGKTAMESQWKSRAAKSIIGVVVAILLFFAAGIKIPGLDHKTDAYFKEAMTKAGLAK
jgi:hypothetical protein